MRGRAAVDHLPSACVSRRRTYSSVPASVISSCLMGGAGLFLQGSFGAPGKFFFFLQGSFGAPGKGCSPATKCRSGAPASSPARPRTNQTSELPSWRVTAPFLRGQSSFSSLIHIHVCMHVNVCMCVHESARARTAPGRPCACPGCRRRLRAPCS